MDRIDRIKKKENVFCFILCILCILLISFLRLELNHYSFLTGTMSTVMGS